jgi:hypothetical protein
VPEDRANWWPIQVNRNRKLLPLRSIVTALFPYLGFWTALMGMVVDGFLYATSMFSAAPYDAQKGTAYQQAPEEFNIG